MILSCVCFGVDVLLAAAVFTTAAALLRRRCKRAATSSRRKKFFETSFSDLLETYFDMFQIGGQRKKEKEKKGKKQQRKTFSVSVPTRQLPVLDWNFFFAQM